MHIAPHILILTCFTFVHYVTLGMALIVIPGYLHGELGMSAFASGLVLGLQFASTFISRPFMGRMMDTLGPRTIVIGGLCLVGISGLFLVASDIFVDTPWLCITLLLLSRILHGVSESCVGTGVVIWSIGRIGPQFTGNIISFNGVMTYSALALGAPAGAWLLAHGALASVGLFMTAITCITAGVALTRAPVPRTPPAKRPPFHKVMLHVLPNGLAMMLSTIGFGTIATFVTLFFADQQWNNAALAMTTFGFSFVGTRLLFANAIRNHGGYKVAMISSCVETIGLAMLWLAPSPAIAIAGASLSGFGLSLVFPALAVEAVRDVATHMRGMALSAYTIFQDIAIGLAAPVAGYIAGLFSYADAFLLAAVLALSSVIVSSMLYRQRPHIPIT